MEFTGLTSASHMSLPEAGYGSEEGHVGSKISGAVSGVTTPGASRLQASQLQERSTTMQRLHNHPTLSLVSCVPVRCPLPFLGWWPWWLCFGSLFPCLCCLCLCLLSGPFGFLFLPLSLQDVILLTFRELNAEILYTFPMHFLYTGSPVNKLRDILL